MAVNCQPSFNRLPLNGKRETEAAIRIRAIDAVRIGIRDLIDQIRRKTVLQTDQQPIIVRVAGGVRHIQSAESRRGPGILIQLAWNHGIGMNKRHNTVLDRRNGRVEIVEGEQVHALSPGIAHGEQVVFGQLVLERQTVFKAVGGLVNAVIRAIGLTQKWRSAAHERDRPVRVARKKELVGGIVRRIGKVRG